MNLWKHFYVLIWICLIPFESHGKLDWFANEPMLPLHESAMNGLHQPSQSTHLLNCQPRQIHLSIGKYAWSTMTISFTILRQCEHESIFLFYGSDLRQLRIHPIDPINRLQYNYTSDIFPFYESGSIYHVELTQLQPNQRYYYQILVSPSNEPNPRHRELLAHSSKTSILTFKTSPRIPKGTKMAIVADLGQTYHSTVTMFHMYKHSLSDDFGTPASIVLCAGDMSYADTNQKRWDHWFELIEPLISQIPMQVAPGNHEIECDENVFLPYETRFHMPSQPPIIDHSASCDSNYTDTTYSYEYGNSYYAFTQGLTRVIVLNSYASISPESKQYHWLQHQLSNIQREKTPWILVMVHVPLYNTFSAHQHENTTEYMLAMVEPLFLQYHVNLVISGHAHGYSRSTNVAYGNYNAKAPIYITVGEGGNREHHSQSYRYSSPESWIIKRDITEYGFGTMEFLNNTYAEWKWIRNENAASFQFTDQTMIRNQYYL